MKGRGSSKLHTPVTENMQPGLKNNQLVFGLGLKNTLNNICACVKV